MTFLNVALLMLILILFIGISYLIHKKRNNHGLIASYHWYGRLLK
ncbi:MAG: hypothetical protein K0R92_3003 [Lachnospiraceae bacterium]|nr:hypothetical protein [Lachnospiraceae bacterium]